MRLKNRRQPTTIVAPPVPAEPARPAFKPAWYAGRFGDLQHSTRSLRQLVEIIATGALRLPRWQRPFVWTDEQVIRLFGSFIGGYHVGSVILWDQPIARTATVEVFGGIEVVSPADGWPPSMVVDGQQRLGSLYAMAMSGRFYVDMIEGCLVCEPGPWRIPAAMVLDRNRTRSGYTYQWHREHATEHGLDEHDVSDAMCAVQDTLDNRYVSAVILPRDWDRARVVESFKRLATEGTRMDPMHLDAALARATEDA